MANVKNSGNNALDQRRSPNVPFRCYTMLPSSWSNLLLIQQLVKPCIAGQTLQYLVTPACYPPPFSRPTAAAAEPMPLMHLNILSLVVLLPVPELPGPLLAPPPYPYPRPYPTHNPRISCNRRGLHVHPPSPLFRPTQVLWRFLPRTRQVRRYAGAAGHHPPVPTRSWRRFLGSAACRCHQQLGL